MARPQTADGDEEKPPEQELSEPLMDLTNIGRTVDGAGFAYLSMSCVNKRINPIKCIEGYMSLQHIDLSQNAIKDVAPLKGLQYVLKLNLSSNEIANIKSWEEGTFPHLLHLDLSNNLLSVLNPLPFPALKSASFACNDIANCAEFGGHANLTSLDLSENKLSSLAGLANMPLLTSLNVSGGERNGLPSNQVASIEGLAELPALEVLALARNKLPALEGAWQDLATLKALDISENAIEYARPASGEKPPEHPLAALRQLPKLTKLEVAGNPLTVLEEGSDVDVRPEVLTCHWRLESIDGVAVSAEEKEKARLLNVRMLEEEKARKKAEEEAAAAAEGGD